MTETENKAIKKRITRLIEYALESLRIDIYTNENINTTTCKKMVQKYKADKEILEDCLIWMSEK